MGGASRTGREHLQGSSPPDSTERALVVRDPRGAAGVPLKIGCLTTTSRFFSDALLALGGL